MKKKEQEKPQDVFERPMKSYLVVQGEKSGQGQFRFEEEKGGPKKPKAYRRRILAAVIAILVLAAAGGGLLHEWPLFGNYSLIPGVGIAQNANTVWLLPKQEIAPFESDGITYEIQARYYQIKDAQINNWITGDQTELGRLQVDLSVIYESEQQEDIDEIEEWCKTNEQQIFASQITEIEKPSLIQGLEDNMIVRLRSDDSDLLGVGSGNLKCSRVGKQFVFTQSTMASCSMKNGGSIMVELPGSDKEIPITFAPAKEYHYLRSLGTVKKWGDTRVVIRQNKADKEEVSMQIYSLLSIGVQQGLWINPYSNFNNWADSVAKEWQPYLVGKNQAVYTGVTKSNQTDYYFPDAPKGQRYQLVIPKTIVMKINDSKASFHLKLEPNQEQWPLEIPLSLEHAKVTLNQAQCMKENSNAEEAQVNVEGTISGEDAGYTLTSIGCVYDNRDKNGDASSLYMMPDNEYNEDYLENGTEESQDNSPEQKRIRGNFYIKGQLPDPVKIQMIMESYDYEQPFTYSFSQ